MPKLYDELASWWPLLSAPADYAEEADFFRHVLMESCDSPPRTLVKYGSGGGNNALHRKAHFHMTTGPDLRRALETAFVHCRNGGVALFVPDHVRETFTPGTDHGGHDGEKRSLRYLEWTYDPDPTDTNYVVDFAYLLREADGSMRVEYDRHLDGLCGRNDWLRLLRAAGFLPNIVSDSFGRDIFVAIKPVASEQ